MKRFTVRAACWSCLLGLLCLTSLGSTPAAENGPGEEAAALDPTLELRVMSFNVRYGTARDGENSWPSRRTQVIAAIKEFAPDLLGTQETWPFQAEFIQEQIPGYAYIGWPRQKDPRDQEQCGMLYRTSRFEKLDAGQFWYSSTPDQVGSKGWDAALPRVATWIKLRDKTQQREMLWINTHFDHRGRQARLEAARQLRRYVDQQPPDLPVLLTGDFNCGEGSPPYQALLVAEAGSRQLIDSYRDRHADRSADEGTFNGFQGTRSGARIDWILHTDGWKCVQAVIDGKKRDGRYPSDHFAVTAVLQWNDRASGRQP